MVIQAPFTILDLKMWTAGVSGLNLKHVSGAWNQDEKEEKTHGEQEGIVDPSIAIRQRQRMSQNR